jgi:mannosyltransferase
VLESPDVIFGGVVAGAVIVLGVLGMSRSWPVILLAAWALVPMAGLVLAGQFTRLYLSRYVQYIVPAWALLSGVTLSRLRVGRAVAVLITLGVLGGVHTQINFRVEDGHSQGTAQAAAIVADGYQPGDAIAYSLFEPSVWVARDVVSRYVPDDRQPRDVFAVRPQRADGNLAATECADLTACLDRAAPPRMWVVRLGAFPADPLRGLGTDKENLLRSRYRLNNLWSLRGMTVALYGRA